MAGYNGGLTTEHNRNWKNEENLWMQQRINLAVEKDAVIKVIFFEIGFLFKPMLFQQLPLNIVIRVYVGLYAVKMQLIKSK